MKVDELKLSSRQNEAPPWVSIIESNQPRNEATLKKTKIRAHLLASYKCINSRRIPGVHSIDTLAATALSPTGKNYRS